MRARSIPTLVVAGIVFVGVSPARAVDPIGEAQPTAEDQGVIYALNRARSDPAKYGRSIGVDLSAVPARPPLAVNRNLVGSSRYHAQDQREYDYRGHFNSQTSQGPNQMAVLNGYDVFGLGLDFGWSATANTIESVAWGYNLIPKWSEALALLIEDKGVAGAGHRVHLLAIGDGYAGHREIGVGKATSGVQRWYVLQTAYRNLGDTFLTGVVYSDTNRNGRYDAGEGISGATVAAGGSSTVSMSAGGYSLQVPDGRHDVTCSGGTFAGESRARVTIAGQNVEVDFRSGNRGAQIGFVQVDVPAVPGPVVTVAPAALAGAAPLAAAFDGTSSSPATTWAWDFGDAGSSPAEDPSYTFAEGVWPVVATGTDDEGTGQCLAVVAAGGAAQGGTTAPASSALTVRSGLFKVFRTRADTATAALRFALPGTFPGPEGITVTVCLGGASKTFTLDARGRARDLVGTAKLAYRRPKTGLVADGTMATLTVTLKGELDALVAAGLRDATERRVVPGAMPFGLVFAGHAYAGSRPFLVNSKAGIKSVAKPAP